MALKQRQIWNQQFISLFLIEICIDFGMMMTRPIVSNFAITLGAAIATAGFIAGTNMLAAFLMRPFSGLIADRIDKKKILIASCCAFAISAVGNTLSSSITLIVFFCAIQGVALSFKSISVFSMAALCVPPERIGTGIGWIGFVITAATAVGPGVGGYIGATYDYRLCFIASSILMAASLIMALRLKAPENSKGRSIKPEIEKGASANEIATSITKMVFYPPVFSLALIAGIAMLVPNAMSGLVLTVTDMGYLEGGSIYFVAYAAVAIVSRPLAGRISDSRSLLAVAFPGLIIAAAGMAALLLWHGVEAVAVCGICMGLGQASSQSAIQASAVRGVDPAHLGRATNTYYLGVDLGGALGPVMGGLILEHFGGSAMFLTCSACLLIACMLLVVSSIARNKRNRAF